MTEQNTSQRRGLAPIGATVARIARPLFRRRGFAAGAVITDWPAIVGPHLASIATPERLMFERGKRDQGTLAVRVASAFGPEVQHLSVQILEKVNVHFGYPAVARLKILPGAMPEPPRPSAPPSPAPEPPSEDTLNAVSGIADPELRAALERLGRALKAAAEPRRRTPPKVVGDK